MKTESSKSAAISSGIPWDLGVALPTLLFVPSCLCVKSSTPSRKPAVLAHLGYQILSDNYHITLTRKTTPTALICRELRNFPFALRKTDYHIISHRAATARERPLEFQFPTSPCRRSLLLHKSLISQISHHFFEENKRNSCSFVLQQSKLFAGCEDSTFPSWDLEIRWYLASGFDHLRRTTLLLVGCGFAALCPFVVLPRISMPGYSPNSHSTSPDPWRT